MFSINVEIIEPILIYTFCTVLFTFMFRIFSLDCDLNINLLPNK